MHGGDVYRNKVKLDFSININPMGAPDSANTALTTTLFEMEQYPDIKCEGLRRALSEYYLVSEERIVCGNGASELIMAICHAKRPKTALLAAPCFQGYETALAAVDTKISYHLLEEERKFVLDESFATKILETSPEIVFLANPNNPTGMLVDKNVMLSVANACKMVKATLVIDECYMELVKRNEEYSFIGLEKHFTNVIILRAYTETYALPGLRLGSAICSTVELQREILHQLPEWNISMMAQNVGIVALREKKYLENSIKVVDEQRYILSNRLRELGIRTYPSNANYILIRENRTDLYTKLLERGVLIRDCSDYVGLGKGYYRIAVKRVPQNESLLRYLREILAHE